MAARAKRMLEGIDTRRMAETVEALQADPALDALLAFAHAHSPVCQSVCRPVPVVLERRIMTSRD